MTSPFLTGVSDATLLEVGESWTQENRDLYAWTKLPVVNALGRNNGVGSITYNLPKEDNFMAKTDGLRDWTNGQQRRPARGLGKDTKTFTTKGRDVVPLSRPTNRNPRHIWRDLERNIIPGLLGEIYGGIELEFITALLDGTLATSKTFSGTGVLDTYKTNSDHDPIGDIHSHLEETGMRWRARRPGFGITCFASERVLRLMSRHPAWSGNGATSGLPDAIPMQVLRARFAELLGVDEVVEPMSVHDTVRRGQTSAPKVAGRNALAFCVLDKRGEADLTSQDSSDAPDGCVQYAKTVEPNVTSTVDTRVKSEFFDADCGFSIFSPRGATWGIYYAGSEIFTTP